MLRLVTIHGIGQRDPGYSIPFLDLLRELLGQEVIGHEIWWDDLFTYSGLGTAWASKVDYAMDIIRFWTRRAKRRALRDRIQRAIHLASKHNEPVILVTHSWGNVLAWNYVPHDRVLLWVNFHSRRYMPTWFRRPPRVGRWANVWSENDVLSGRMDHRRCTEYTNHKEGHGPMWDNKRRVQFVMQLWRAIDPKKGYC